MDGSDVRKSTDQSAQAAVRERITALPRLTPKALETALGTLGYRGQERARRALCLFAYRHLERLRAVYLAGEPREGLPPPGRALLLGPTGCGKTHLVELLFAKILGVPVVVSDMTGYTETGYVGDNVRWMLARLVAAAGGDPAWAGCGVVCMDEFDKLAGGVSAARFAGQGTTKDVSGMGVQRELLKMMDGGHVDITVGYDMGGPEGARRFDASDVAFVGCGAFAGLNLTAAAAAREGAIGFGRRIVARPQGRIAEAVEQEIADRAEVFQKYGFLPELIGRFSRYVVFEPLNRATLETILRDNVVGAYRREFARAGIHLDVPRAVLAHIAREAEKRETGARGLHAALVQTLEQAAFDAYSAKSPGTIRLRAGADGLAAAWRPAARRQSVPAEFPAAAVIG